MSEEERQALRDSDPAAFDAEADGDEDKAIDADGTADADNGDGGDKNADVEGNVEGDDDKKKDDDKGDAAPPMVPKSQLTGVVKERNEFKELSKRQAAELEELRKRMGDHKAPRDFDAEFSGIQDKYDKALQDYDAGEISIDELRAAEKDKNSGLRKLNQDEARFISQQESLKTAHETQTANANRTWAEDVSAWSDKNPGFLAEEGNKEVFQRALKAVVAYRGADITNEQLLAEAAEMAFRDTGYAPPAGSEAPKGEAQQRIAARRDQNGKAAAAAAATPPANRAGTGTRARGAEPDLAGMKPGKFSQQFTRAQQEEILGGPGAL